MAKFNSPHVPASTPRMGNALTRLIGRGLLRAIGWKISGTLPDVKKTILIGFPHTSNWDFYIAMGFMLSLGVKFSWMMKKEAFFWPLGPLWKVMGGIPIDRKAKTDIIGQVTERIHSADKVLLGITPEGTRTKVGDYKKGYLRIAYAADIPIFIVGLNGPEKTVVLDRIWPVTGDADTDNAALKSYIDETYIGIRPEKA